jgi:micrococcal nuclease
MYGFVLLCGWVLAAIVIGLAWAGSRPHRRLGSGLAVGAVAGLLWPVTLWIGAGVLVAQRRRAFGRRPRTGIAVLGCTVTSVATLGLLGGIAPPAPVSVVGVASAQESAPVVAAAPPAPQVDRAVVTAVVDGDTLDVDIDGRTLRVGMLDVQAPELSDPDADRGCLGPEAAAFVSTLAPAGSPVELEYDGVRTDGQGRTLAGVRTATGALVNAEVVKAGLAAVVQDGSSRFRAEVDSAQREAVEQGRGLYSADAACTLPGRAAAVTAALATVPAAATLAAPADEMDRIAGDARKVVTLAAAARDAFSVARDGVVWAVYPPQEHERFAADATRAWESAVRAESELRAAATAARTREEDAARARAEEQAAAARVEAAHAEEARAEKERAEKARAEKARAEKAPAVERPRPAPAPEPDRPAPSAPKGGSGPAVHPGAFCSNAGATGVTVKGKAMRCQLDSKGQRLRWASA